MHFYSLYLLDLIEYSANLDLGFTQFCVISAKNCILRGILLPEITHSLFFAIFTMGTLILSTLGEFLVIKTIILGSGGPI